MGISNYLISEILETISEAVVFHAADGHIEYVNKQAEIVLGLTRDQILGKTPRDPQWQTYKEDMTVLEPEDHPSTYTLQTQKAKHNFLMGIYKGDGSFVWININSKPLFEETRFLGAALTFTDVTEEINKSKMIRTQSGYLDLILKSTPIILYAINKQGVFTYSKGAGLKPLGLKDDEVIEKNVYEIYKGNETILNSIDKCLKTGTAAHYEAKIGELYYISYIVPTHNSNNEIDGLMGFAYDITENENNKKALVLQTRQAQIGEMLSVIAHQWRQPLTAINANLMQMMILLELEKFNSDTFKNLIQKSEGNITHLSETINFFRDFFKPEEAKERIDLREVFNFVMELMADTLSSHNITLNFDLIKQSEIYSYNHDLIQVIMNLFENVVDIVKEKKLQNTHIEVSASIKDEWVVIEVADDAGGISKESIDQIFTPYYSTKKNLQGTGLGLYMCKNIIEERCGGIMRAFNRSNGAVFSISLPLEPK